jgi:hypothetical protein
LFVKDLASRVGSTSAIAGIFVFPNSSLTILIYYSPFAVKKGCACVIRIPIARILGTRDWRNEVAVCHVSTSYLDNDAANEETEENEERREEREKGSDIIKYRPKSPSRPRQEVDKG